MDILRFYLVPKADRERGQLCNNEVPAILRDDIDATPEDEDIIKYISPQGITYCFDPVDINDIISTRKNPFTREPIPDDYIQGIKVSLM